MIRKRVKNRSSGSYLGKGFYLKLGVIGAIIILIIGAFLFVNLKSVGKAGEAPCYGEEYTYCPTEGAIGKEKTGEVYRENPSIESLKSGKCNDSVCAGFCEKGYCFSNTAKIYDCFASNSVVRFDDFDSFCKPLTAQDNKDNNYNWIDCEGEWKGTVISGNEQFYCSKETKGRFYPCIDELNGEVNPNTEKKYLCVASSNKWMTCDDKIGDKKLQLNDRFVCGADKVWSECKDANKGISGTKKYYCSKDGDNKWKWKECTKAGLSADLTQLCQQEGTPATWKWAV
ncbi:hypothetical protein HZC30_05540 [Candidatus Woesearchaeota archaeon]|nr:hypothetical protein [Candidatus Woesearchaeota archaeon]